MRRLQYSLGYVFGIARHLLNAAKYPAHAVARVAQKPEHQVSSVVQKDDDSDRLYEDLCSVGLANREVVAFNIYFQLT